ncbi:MAG: YncE family protein, partial [Stellaceae bacterium]
MIQPVLAADSGAPLVLEATIPLDRVQGRIDHLAVDVTRKRLMVAELGNGTVDVIDLTAAKAIHRLTGFDEPQGVGYFAARDAIAVANGGDGSVRLFRADDFSPAGRIELGSDADNVRIDRHGRLLVGYGAGALAVFDKVGALVARVPLKAHPEAFQSAPGSDWVYVNVPDAHEIAVIDLAAGTQVTAWPLGALRANFPMVLDAAGKRVVVATRDPPRLVAFAMATGEIESQIAICGDADDVFLDAKRRRFYVSCGEGVIDVVEGGDRL